LSDERASHTGEPAPATRVLGVLGGICSGKSLVARLLAGPDGRVVTADREAHAVLASDAGVAFLRERFGDDVLLPDGTPDRAALAGLVFAPDDPAAAERRAALEGFTHPLVRARILAALDEARAARVPRVVLDVPLLLENDAQHGFVALCDALVFVDVEDAERERRARRDRGWPPGEVARREAAQLPLAEKRRRADHVLSNHGTVEDLERSARELLADL
jgi:dephospho-CoA kinase